MQQAGVHADGAGSAARQRAGRAGFLTVGTVRRPPRYRPSRQDGVRVRRGPPRRRVRRVSRAAGGGTGSPRTRTRARLPVPSEQRENGAVQRVSLRGPV